MKEKSFVFSLLIVIVSALVMAGCPKPYYPPPRESQAVAAPAAEPQPAYTEGIILDGAGNYTVVQGDTLADIAARQYGGGNAYYFPLIRLANAGVVSDPDVIEVGTNLVIPNLQPNINSDGAKTAMRSDMLSIAQQYDRQEKPNAAATLRNLAARLGR
jgi:hypothetical protein